MGLSQHTPDSVAIFPLFRMSLKAEVEDETPSQQYRLVEWIPAERGRVGGGKNVLFLSIFVSVCNSWKKFCNYFIPAPYQSWGFCLSLHPCLESIGRGNETEVFPVPPLAIVHDSAVAFCCASGVLHLWSAAPSWWRQEPSRERVSNWWLAAGPVHLQLLPVNPALPIWERKSLILWV